jgi:hypothetical protein
VDNGLVKGWRSDTQDLIQIIFDAVDDQFRAASFVEDAGDDTVEHPVSAAAQADSLADQRKRELPRDGLRSKPGISMTLTVWPWSIEHRD